VTKALLQALIEHLSYAFAAPMRTFLRPLHLLLFGKPLTSQFATILSGKLFVIQETVDDARSCDELGKHSPLRIRRRINAFQKITIAVAAFLVTGKKNIAIVAVMAGPTIQ
jgi:hypothetical protein